MKPVSRTAFYCCGIRAWDAARAHPLCGDEYAKRCMSAAGHAYVEKFRSERLANAGSVIRHRIIDDLLRDEIRRDARQTVFLLGAGFDSRAYRLSGGQWIEFDAPELIAYKNECLPVAECANPLRRVAFDFDNELLRDGLAPFASSERVLIVLEGVLVYLDSDAICTLIADLTATFPHHVLIADIMTRAMFRTYARSMRRRLDAEHAALQVTEDDPTRLFTTAGYTAAQRISIPGALALTRAWRGAAIELLMRNFFCVLHDGYTVNVLCYDAPTAARRFAAS